MKSHSHERDKLTGDGDQNLKISGRRLLLRSDSSGAAKLNGTDYLANGGTPELCWSYIQQL
jgi:hypothetical protein